jgi:dihydrofolate reductase
MSFKGDSMNSTRKVILFSAMSLDGFIAKTNGNIEWLFDIPNIDKTDHGYKDFYKTIDTTIMGRKTYDQILLDEGNESIIYPGKKNYVFSHIKRKSTDSVEFISDDIVSFIKELKTKPGKDIWILGGGQVNSMLFENNLIDTLQLQIFPILLNHGIPLSNCDLDEIKFKLIRTEVFPTGVIGVLYEKENDI